MARYTSSMLAYLCKDIPVKFELRKIAVNTSGYTARGEYYGNGQPLYRALSEVKLDDEWNDIHLELRASDRAEAKAIVRAQYPKATFNR